MWWMVVESIFLVLLQACIVQFASADNHDIIFDSCLPDSCPANQAFSFETFILVQFDGPISTIPEPTLDSMALLVREAYDVVAGAVCDSCQRRVTELELVEPDSLVADGNRFLRDIEMQELVMDQVIEVAATEANDYFVFRVFIEQTGICASAFDTNVQETDELVVDAFIESCTVFYSADTCFCANPTFVGAVSSDDFRRELDRRVDTASVINVLELRENPNAGCDGSVTVVQAPLAICFDWSLNPEDIDDFVDIFVSSYNRFTFERCVQRRIASARVQGNFGADCTGLKTCYIMGTTFEIRDTTTEGITDTPFFVLREGGTFFNGVSLAAGCVIPGGCGPGDGDGDFCNIAPILCRRRMMGTSSTLTHFDTRELLLDTGVVTDECLCPVGVVGSYPQPSAFLPVLNAELLDNGFGIVSDIPEVVLPEEIEVTTCARSEMPSQAPTPSPTKGKGSKGSKGSRESTKGKGSDEKSSKSSSKGSKGKGSDEKGSTKGSGKGSKESNDKSGMGSGKGTKGSQSSENHENSRKILRVRTV